MGRAKLNMELISKEKSRNTTFKKRKEGLIRKLHEFTTLCDVKACMIIYGPKQENGAVEPEIWPQNVDEIRDIIDFYKSKKKDSGNKAFGLNDFFDDRKRKIEDELSKLRKRNMEVKYPTPLDLISRMNEGELRAFALKLRDKAELVKSRIQELKNPSREPGVIMDVKAGGKSQIHPHPPLLHDMHIPELKGPFYPQPPPIRDMHLPVPIYYPTIDHQQQIQTVNQKSMKMLLMNGEDQFGGASSSNIGGNIHCASFKQQIFYERSLLLPHYYAPPLQLPPLPPYMVAPPQLPFPTGGENQYVDREDVVQYQMKNHRG